ncbi:aspartyl/asparaginyl beta-hydroxylase domain-containing protein [Porticoccaceae bacterium]|nr:aspartyl/asparaginyl beta-hydroxylase domain-containing protein [Porticoccaceae bacterium]MDC0000542.1 aspartyl/asparaginyl beta-hydroxylase domain-containing protein [Porticoccaceae bacterium]MDC0004475.1 aspartyl/asparaginyl beta-hydroxylase domain-containing protein [Porticoccaceae bacterium]
MKLAQPFVRLPYQFDALQLQSEIAKFADDQWMEHPSKLAGNLAIPLISLNGQRNNDFDGPMAVTPELLSCDYMQQVMGSFGEVLARSRLMRLDAGAQVSEHVDFNYHWYSRVRIHIPIITNPQVIFHCGDQAIHMRAGECWIFDSWRRHKVVNASDQDRVHLVIDTSGSSRFWQTVREMESFGIEDNTAALQGKIKEHPYQPTHQTNIKTERYNIAPVMAPGEFEAIVNELINDIESNSDNDPQLGEKYKNLLISLAKDWRENWHLHGYEEAGWIKYRELLGRAVSQLDPNPRALINGSNQVGLNPIIMQRLIHAALNVEQISAYTNKNS